MSRMTAHEWLDWAWWARSGLLLVGFFAVLFGILAVLPLTW